MAPTSLKTSAQVIQALNLSAHIEGGYYRRTYQADRRDLIATAGGERFLLTSIYYLLTQQAPIGHFHLNTSDIIHYYHLGDPIRYSLIYPDGSLASVDMGCDICNGQQLQLVVPGGVWKASELLPGPCGYGLISEAVTPGFDFADMRLGKCGELVDVFPQHGEVIARLTRE